MPFYYTEGAFYKHFAYKFTFLFLKACNLKMVCTESDTLKVEIPVVDLLRVLCAENKSIHYNDYTVDGVCPIRKHHGPHHG